MKPRIGCAPVRAAVIGLTDARENGVFVAENTLQERITLLRKQRGILQKDVASGIGVSFGTYQKYEYKGVPSRKNIEKLVSFYGCSKAWILTGEGDPYPKTASIGLDAILVRSDLPPDEFVFISRVHGKISAGG